LSGSYGEDLKSNFNHGKQKQKAMKREITERALLKVLRDFMSIDIKVLNEKSPGHYLVKATEARVAMIDQVLAKSPQQHTALKKGLNRIRDINESVYRMFLQSRGYAYAETYGHETCVLTCFGPNWKTAEQLEDFCHRLKGIFIQYLESYEYGV